MEEGASRWGLSRSKPGFLRSAPSRGPGAPPLRSGLGVAGFQSPRGPPAVVAPVPSRLPHRPAPDGNLQAEGQALFTQKQPVEAGLVWKKERWRTGNVAGGGSKKRSPDRNL